LYLFNCELECHEKKCTTCGMSPHAECHHNQNVTIKNVTTLK
jgi:hypothetical protein